jgi:hypothetical protein
MSHGKVNVRQARIERLRSGDWSFGCDGRHYGNGSEGCPLERHHHHDAFCRPPTQMELHEADIDPAEFKVRSRA